MTPSPRSKLASPTCVSSTLHLACRESETFYLGANKVPVKFERTRCLAPSCGKIGATPEQSAKNKARLVAQLKKVKHGAPPKDLMDRS